MIKIGNLTDVVAKKSRHTSQRKRDKSKTNGDTLKLVKIYKKVESLCTEFEEQTGHGRNVLRSYVYCKMSDKSDEQLVESLTNRLGQGMKWELDGLIRIPVLVGLIKHFLYTKANAD